jgi:hypothetical protein
VSKYLILRSLFTATTFEVAHAQRLPTDVELKAAYCLKVTQGFVANTVVPNNADPAVREYVENARKDADDRLNRLQLYLLPRMRELESFALVAAFKRGETDSATFWRSVMDITDKCAKECGVIGATGEVREKAMQCLERCVTSDQLLARIMSCGKLNWLPF